MWYKSFSKKSIWSIDESVTDTNTQDKSGPGTGTPHSQELKDVSLTTRCSLMSYPGHLSWMEVLLFNRIYT